MSATRLVATILVVACLTSSDVSSQSPGSWKTFEHVDTGLRLRYPGGFAELPLQPYEKLIIGRFKRDEPLRARKRDTWRRPAEFWVFVVEGGTTGQKVEIDDPIERHNAFHDLPSFMKARFPRHGYEEIERDDRKKEVIHRLYLPGQKRDVEIPKERHRTGILITRNVDGAIWGVLGEYDVEVDSLWERDLRKVARGIEKPEGYRAVRDEGEEFYRTRGYLGFKDVPFRIEARRALVRGWKPLDTENFFVMYHTENDDLVRKIANDLEAIRVLFEQHFPPPAPIEKAAVVRVCQDVREYLQYGGPAGSAGYWNPAVKELVFFDNAAKIDGERRGTDADSALVMYHEAFHQYIYFALGDFSPDYWFNEGIADYFGGTIIYASSNKVKEIGLNGWRLPVVKKLVDTEHFIPLKELLAAQRAQFYDPRKIGRMYPLAWAFVYFLVATEEGRAEPAWTGIITRYYETLIAAKAELLDPLIESGKPEEIAAAEGAVRKRAMDAAFEGVDVDRLEAAWKQWIRDVKNPFPER